MNIIERAKNIASENGFEVDLPELNVGDRCSLADVWDGEGEAPEEGYSYELGDGDFIEYSFKMINATSNILDSDVEITGIYIG